MTPTQQALEFLTQVLKGDDPATGASMLRDHLEQHGLMMVPAQFGRDGNELLVSCVCNVYQGVIHEFGKDRKCVKCGMGEISFLGRVPMTSYEVDEVRRIWEKRLIEAMNIPPFLGPPPILEIEP